MLTGLIISVKLRFLYALKLDTLLNDSPDISNTPLYPSVVAELLYM